MDHWIFFSARVEEEGPLFGRPVFLHGGSLERLNGLPWHSDLIVQQCAKRPFADEEAELGGKRAWRHDKFEQCLCVWCLSFFLILTFFYFPFCVDWYVNGRA